MKRAALAIVAIALAGCGTSPPIDSAEQQRQSPHYTTATQVRDALEKSGIGCGDYLSIDRAHRDMGEEDALETGSCSVENRRVSILIWQTEGPKLDWADLQNTVGCRLASGLDRNPPMWVDGGTWTISLDSRIVTDRISKAIGGQTKFTDCRQQTKT